MTFSLRRATAADASALTAVFQSSFSKSAMASLVFPRTPATANFWTASVLADIAHPNYHFICLVHQDEYSAEKNIVAYAKWNDPNTLYEEQNDRPKWPEGADHEFANHFFETLHSNHCEIMGVRRHWYLDVLAVADDYQGKGCGKMLINWACKSTPTDWFQSYSLSVEWSYAWNNIDSLSISSRCVSVNWSQWTRQMRLETQFSWRLVQRAHRYTENMASKKWIRSCLISDRRKTDCRMSMRKCSCWESRERAFNVSHVCTWIIAEDLAIDQTVNKTFRRTKHWHIARKHSSSEV